VQTRENLREIGHVKKLRGVPIPTSHFVVVIAIFVITSITPTTIATTTTATTR
jgi:hypothetical protein